MHAAAVGTVGTVLDAIVSLRQRIRVLPGAAVRLAFTTGMAADRFGPRRIALFGVPLFFVDLGLAVGLARWISRRARTGRRSRRCGRARG